MNRHRSNLLLKHFLKNSPATQLKQYQTLFPGPINKKAQAQTPADSTYLQNFLRSVEVFGTPVSMIKLNRDLNMFDMRKMFGQDKLNCRPYHTPESEAQQIQQCIREMSNLNKVNLAQYQEIEQRLVIAKPETLRQIKVKLVYLFKILINKRDKHPQESLEVQANISLTDTLISIFSRLHSQGIGPKEWHELQALDKLTRARQDRKNGLNSNAKLTFEAIFKDEAATNHTRLEALKSLCEEGEEQKDSSFLQPLFCLAQEKGQKEYQEYLRLTIQRIKQAENKDSQK